MRIQILIITSLLFLIISSCSLNILTKDKKDEFVIMGYYMSGENYELENLHLEKLTHIIYSFTEVINNKMEFKYRSNHESLRELVNQKKNHPNLKVMIACGGWGGSDGFSDMAAKEETRNIFIESVISFIDKSNIDGLDIDWEYPGMPGIGNPYRPEDKENFSALMKELREAMDKTNKNLILSFAAAGWERYFDHIELLEIMKYADYINMMTYDMTGGGTPVTAHHTNLGKMELSDIKQTPAFNYFKNHNPQSAQQIIDYIQLMGVNPNQIVIGCAFYGKAWKGVAPENSGLYQHNKGAWNPTTITYRILKANYENKNGYKRYWDSIAMAPFLYNPIDSIFISYDDTASVKSKTKYALENKLGGVMFWELKQDAEENGLLDAIYRNQP